MDFRDRIRKSVEKHATKQMRENRPKRTNGKPERKLQSQMLSWLNARGFFAFPLESKAVYSSAAGRYLDSQSRVGASDILGLTEQGYFLAVEVKSQGQRSTLRAAQRIFLESVISRGGFAVCSDSLEHLETVYLTWLRTDPSKRPSYLMDNLPKAKASDEQDSSDFISGFKDPSTP